MAETSGPEKFAPPDRRPAEKRGDLENIAFLHKQRSGAESANSPQVEELNTVVRRIAGDSMEEIDRVIRALEDVRDMMRKEGERVSREIAGYASLSHAASTAMRVIADSLKQWKEAPNKSDPVR